MVKDISGFPYFTVTCFSFYKQENMEMIKRAGFLAVVLQSQFETIAEGEEHRFFVNGENSPIRFAAWPRRSFKH